MNHTLATLLTAVVLFAGAFQVQADEIVSAGSFAGHSDHETSGAGSIIRDKDGKYFVVLGDDFSLDGAPDPRVGLGKDGYQASTDLGKLQRKNGKQVYAIPASIDPNEFNEIWIWCKRFSVGLGVAKLS
ncbi:MAG: DM13 domain-containing protein [Verrucomicrobiota bacterium]